MCGISGLVNFFEPVSLAGYYAAHLRLRHRGKDDEGFFAVQQGRAWYCRGDDSLAVFNHYPHIETLGAANLVLGHRRLSIIDVSPGGHQPMSYQDGRYTMIFNGEIYNYIELRDELQTLGHRFTTQSDAEVLLAAFAQWDTGCFSHFNGMWAVAIYDDQRQRLVLSRDRFGVKPLYYAQNHRTLYFASEVKFLLGFLPNKVMNEARAVEFAVQNVVDHHAETIFQGVYQLLPGNYAIFDASGLSQHAYWQLPERKVQLTLEEGREQLLELLSSSIRLRLRSDVPVGSLLSGGLDSTTIVCIVRRLLNEADAGNSFDLFSAVFREEAYSERRYIEDTVAQTQLPIHWIYPDPERLAETLPDLMHHQEFPIRSLAVYSQWEIMRQVSQTPIVVLLNGQGSDEIFGGYTAHYFALIAETLRRLRPGRAYQQARALAQAREISLIQAFAGALRELVRSSPLGNLTRRRPVAYLSQAYTEPQGWRRQPDIFHNALVRNLTFSALPEYLRYEDRNSMAFTLESRLPFMDYRLVEWAMSLPAELKIHNTASKRVLREAARGLIPESILARRDKMGFVSPQEEWQRQYLAPLLEATFSQDLQGRFPFLAEKKCREMYAAYQQGKHNDWAWIWRIANLVWWHQHWWG